MSQGRTMLGGRNYKVIREVLDDKWTNGVVAYVDGEDLCVHPKVFDAFEDAMSRKSDYTSSKKHPVSGWHQLG